MMTPRTFDVVDIETSCHKDSEGAWRSEPWFVNAEGASPKGILFGRLMGWLDGSVPDTCGVFEQPWAFGINEADILVGHNIKFDASHLPKLRDRPVVWDTMIAEYILTAQQAHFASLRILGDKYVPTLTPKGDLISSNLENGIPPQELDRIDLGAYLTNDLTLTAEVFKCQWALASPAEKALIFIQSSASMAYGAIEANGLPLDVPYTIKARDVADADAARLVEAMHGAVAQLVDTETANDLRAANFLMTPTFLSMMFFGSPAKVTVDVPLTADELLAAAKRRVNRKRIFHSPVPDKYAAVIPSVAGSARRTVSAGIYGTDDDVLERIIATGGVDIPASLAKIVRAYRGYAKLSNTYYTPWMKQIESYRDRHLHPKIHSTSTNTGRTSSASPNVQNIPDAARACVTSRFDGGHLVEMDFRQLEVIGLAQVSQCPALIAALNRGDDIHYLSGQRVFGWKSPAEMSKDLRRVVKTINFGLIYGGSAKTLAQQAGVAETVARELIKAFYTAFPGVEKWQKATFIQVEEHPHGVEIRPSASGTIAVHKLTTPTGRTYAFPLEAAPVWMKNNSRPRPSPTKVKNYPVQGFATGDVVPLAVMLVDRMLRRFAPRVVMCNVVHDSMLFDVPPDYTVMTIQDAIGFVIADELPAALKQMWGIEMSVPLTVDFSTPSFTWKAR